MLDTHVDAWKADISNITRETEWGTDFHRTSLEILTDHCRKDPTQDIPERFGRPTKRSIQSATGGGGAKRDVTDKGVHKATCLRPSWGGRLDNHMRLPRGLDQ